MTLTLPDVAEFIKWLEKREFRLLMGWPVSCCYSHSGKRKRK